MTDLTEKIAKPLLRVAPKNSLWAAIKIESWQAIALNYNGPDYKTCEYSQKLYAACERHRSRAR